MMEPFNLTPFPSDCQQFQDLDRFNSIYRIVNERFDVRNTILVHLIHTCLDTKHYVLTDQVRTEFAEQVPQGAFNLVEDCCCITDLVAKVYAYSGTTDQVRRY